MTIPHRELEAAARDRVLVVDDAANLRDLLTLLLETEDDFEVIGTASDGEQALAVAEALQPGHRPARPGDAGHGRHAGAAADPRSCPTANIVIFSGFEQTALVDEALAAGADAYLEKGASVTQPGRPAARAARSARPAVTDPRREDGTMTRAHLDRQPREVAPACSTPSPTATTG